VQLATIVPEEFAKERQRGEVMPIDTERLLTHLVVLPLLSAFLWQILRAIWLLIALKEPFLPGFIARPKVSNKTDRNFIHAKLGTIHCVVVLILTITSFVNHRNETWDQWNYQRTSDLDDKYFVHPYWPLWVSFGYFISDFVYITDFPAYWWHHIFAIVDLACLVSDPACSMVSSQGLFIAETGGILLTVYLQYKSMATHLIFILCYGFTRLVLLPTCLFHMWRSFFSSHVVANVYVAFICNVLSVGLMFINWGFWFTHVKKFRAKMRGEYPGTQKGDVKGTNNGDIKEE